MSYRNYSTVVSHIVDQNGLGDFTTIATAMTAASSGDVIFVRPGTYTEDVTISDGVSLKGDSQIAPSIVGKLSYSGSTASTLENLKITTNGDFAIEVSGSSALNLTISNCSLVGADNTIISVTNSSSSSSVTVKNNSILSLSTTGIAHFSVSNNAQLVVQYSQLRNPGGSTTASTISDGVVRIEFCVFFSPISVTSTGDLSARYSTFSAGDTTCITYNSSASARLRGCYFSSGTAVPITVTSGTLALHDPTFRTTSGTLTDGAGTVQYDSMSSITTGDVISTTTATGGDVLTAGISFDKGTNLLDTYEEGTFTPEFTPGSGAYTTITYGTQTGAYTRIGRVVNISIDIRLTAFSIGTGAGNLSITGLPYAGAFIATGALDANQVDWDPTTYEYLTGRVSGSNVQIIENGDNTSVNITGSDVLTASTRVRFSCTYMA